MKQLCDEVLNFIKSISQEEIKNNKPLQKRLIELEKMTKTITLKHNAKAESLLRYLKRDQLLSN
jgi:hypothetical protein